MPSLLVTGSILVILASSYVLYLQHGGILYGDAEVYLAKLHLTVFGGHFSFLDPYFSKNGVISPGYSTNTVLGLQAVFTKLFRTSVDQIWLSSAGFISLLIWLGLYSLTWIYLRKSSWRWMAYAMLVVAPLFYSGIFQDIQVPRFAAYIFTMLFFIGLKVYLDLNNKVILLISTILLATTHVMNSLDVAGFLLFIMLLLGALKRLKLPQVMTMLSLIIVLLIPVIYALHFPNHIGSNLEQYNAISGGDYIIKYQKYGGIWLSHIWFNMISPIKTFVAIYVAGFLFFCNKINRLDLRILTYGTMIGLVALSNSLFWPSLFGFYLIIKASKDVTTRIVLLSAIFYFGLIIMNPIIMGYAHNNIPPWAITRFQDLNMFALVAPFIGLLYIAIQPLKRWGLGVKLSVLIIGFSMILALPVLFILGQTAINNHSIGLSLDPIHDPPSTVSIQKKLLPFASLMDNQVVLSNSLYAPSLIPSVSLANLVYVPAIGTAPMANEELRKDCKNHLEKSLNLSDLEATDTSIVLVDNHRDATFDHLAAHKPYLHLIKNSYEFSAYKLATTQGVSSYAYPACRIPFGE